MELEWSLSEEFEVIANALNDHEKRNYPPIKKDHIENIKLRTSSLTTSDRLEKTDIKQKVNTKFNPPKFPKSNLNPEEWITATSFYEETLENIDNLKQSDKIKNIVQLEAWFIMLIHPPPQNRSPELNEVWFKKEADKIKNMYTSSCPVEYRKIVKEKIQNYLPKDWREVLTRNVRSIRDKNKSIIHVPLVDLNRAKLK
jgi:hypothetical protein